MTIGVTLNDKHCFDDYGMWLTDVDVEQPEVQTYYVQVPGRTGELDLTEALTGDVRFYNGTTTMTFQTAEKVCGRSWFDQLELVKADLHGQRATFVFDGTGIEYSARCEVSGTPTAGGIYEITVTATVDASEELDPFAFYSADDDSLNFYCGHIPEAGDVYRNKTVTAVYTNTESTGTTTNPPWYSLRESIRKVNINGSYSVARPTSCYRWFYNFTTCTEIAGLAFLNTSEVTTFYYTFYGCGNIKTLAISDWDTSKATTMYGMFYDCSVTSLNLSRWDTSNVTTMQYMFYRCSSLASLNVAGWNTANVTTLNNALRGCSSLTEIDVSTWDTANVNSMAYMFYDCSSLVTIYSDDDVYVTTAVTAGGSMFTNCSKLVGGNGTKYSSSNISYQFAHVDTASNPGYFTEK